MHAANSQNFKCTQFWTFLSLLAIEESDMRRVEWVPQQSRCGGSALFFALDFLDALASLQVDPVSLSQIPFSTFQAWISQPSFLGKPGICSTSASSSIWNLLLSFQENNWLG